MITTYYSLDHDFDSASGFVTVRTVACRMLHLKKHRKAKKDELA